MKKKQKVPVTLALTFMFTIVRFKNTGIELLCTQESEPLHLNATTLVLPSTTFLHTRFFLNLGTEY
jgi:hypothetical protein